MGREVRMVPPTWEHPKKDGKFISLFNGPFASDLANWIEEALQWNNGFRRNYSNGQQPTAARTGQSTADSDLPAITPAVVQDLRDSVKWRVANGQGEMAPHILYMAADERFLLKVSTRAMCASTDIRVLARLLLCERAEPGFVARIMDPATDCRVASLAPDVAAAERRRLAALNAEIAERNRADAERKRTSHVAKKVDVSKMNLDDLL